MAATASAGTEKVSVVDEEKKLSVLVVDDDPIIRKIHVALVKRLGVVAATAANGEEAVKIHRGGESFNLVLMDKEMPIKDGPSATKELRDMGVTSMIVGVTSLADEENERKAFMEAGLDQCLKKPLNMEKLTLLFNQIKQNM